MASIEVSSTVGIVQGQFGREFMVCQLTHMISSQGYALFGGDTFAFTLPVLLAQLVLVGILSMSISFLLEPLKQSTATCQIIAGILLGRSFLGQVKNFSDKLFPPGGRMIIETFANFGFIFHLFGIGIGIDPSIIKKTDKYAITIGLSSFLMAFALGLLGIFILPHLLTFEGSAQSLLYIITTNSISSFAGITSLLTDLQILNSEIGRLASLACLINDIGNYSLFTIITALTPAIKNKQWSGMWTLVWYLFFFCVLVYIVRPLALRMAKRLPDGQPLKESQFLAIVIPVFVCVFLSETFGMPAGSCMFVIGIAIPDGPPLGTSLVQKIDTFCSGLMLPAKLALCGMTVDLYSIKGTSSDAVIFLVIFLGYVGKFSGVLMSGLYANLPFCDAFSLALIMISKSVVDVAIYILMKNNGSLNNEAYALLLITMLIITGIARPLISHLYDPSRRYSGNQRKSVLFSNPKSPLRILVCIHNEDNVPTIINLLAASNPTKSTPISLSILNLMELKGRAAAVLEHSVYRGRLTSMRSRSEHIAKAFNYLEQKNQGTLSVQHFTSIAPYASMHTDICTIAMDFRANIVVVPFHKHWEIDGTIGSNLTAIRTVNQNVLMKAPCSVGILVDRGQVISSQSILAGNSIFQIIMLFLGGPDDREALAYASRTVGHPNIGLTLVWLRLLKHKEQSEADKIESNIDADMIKHFRANTIGNEGVIYKEEMAKDAVGTTRVLRSLEEACDLCIIGRHHDPESPLTQGLTDWNECPELGDIGDMLASSDFKFSLLVVQQQMSEGPEFLSHDSLQIGASGHRTRRVLAGSRR